MPKPSYLIQNQERAKALFPEYDPYIGIGSQIERVRINLSKKTYWLIPVSMLNYTHVKEVIKAGGLHCYNPKKNPCNSKKKFDEYFIKQLADLRIEHDFEFWAATCIQIQHKVSNLMAPFILNAAQRKLLKELEKMRLAGLPIRIILLKARQWGGSTLTQFYMMWIQSIHRENWHSVIATQVLGQASVILNMYDNATKAYPINNLTLANFGKGNVKQIKERGCRICLGSMERPNSLRSDNYSMAHFSEVGLWKTTKGKTPKDVISSITTSILQEPYTVIVEESTAKGQGTYFHKKWLSSVKGENGYSPVFIAWFEIEMYRKFFNNEKEKSDFYNNLNDKGKYLWSLGATLEGINWYINYQHTEDLDDWQMQEEFPSTPEEAFVSSGQRVIPLRYMEQARKSIREPMFIGDVIGDGQKGRQAFQHIRLEANSKGFFKVWKHPDFNNTLRNRYVVSVDIGGRSTAADKSVIRVIDRFWRSDEGVDEFVATWRGNMDVDLVIWKAAQIAMLYDNALLVVESNTIETKYQNTEGDHSYTVFDEIVDFYSNLYVRDDPQKIIDGLPPKYGFHTNKQTKGTLIDNLVAAFRDNNFIEHDQDMMDESDQYERKDDGTYGAKDGCHDDVLMASAIGLYVSNKMNKPIPKSSQMTARVTSSIP